LKSILKDILKMLTLPTARQRTCETACIWWQFSLFQCRWYLHSAAVCERPVPERSQATPTQPQPTRPQYSVEKKIDVDFRQQDQNHNHKFVHSMNPGGKAR